MTGAEQLCGTPGAISPRDAAERSYWLSVLERLARPVLEHLAEGELHKRMPVETGGERKERRRYTHLEAFGRSIAGIAPWLEAAGLGDAERALQRRYIALAQQSLDLATDPRSPDFLNFDRGEQPLVDTAYLAQGILRAPNVLWKDLDARVRQQVIHALLSSRAIATPVRNNWVMFAAMIEAALLVLGQPTLEERLEQSLRRMLGWYKGDGLYGDGPWFHFDPYNSFVIHPMLVDLLAVLDRCDRRYRSAYEIVLGRSRRYAEIQERLIAPDGTFPLVGRSAAYRCGAFHSLAQLALLHQLPKRVRPAQVRSALTAVMQRMLEAPGTFDDNGWLQIGFCGHQATLAEDYVSTGSLYLCSVALLPLGLPPHEPFWADPPAPWTSQRLWCGETLPPDDAIADTALVEIPTLRRERGVRHPLTPAKRLLHSLLRALGSGAEISGEKPSS